MSVHSKQKFRCLSSFNVWKMMLELVWCSITWCSTHHYCLGFTYIRKTKAKRSALISWGESSREQVKKSSPLLRKSHLDAAWCFLLLELKCDKIRSYHHSWHCVPLLTWETGIFLRFPFHHRLPLLCALRATTGKIVPNGAMLPLRVKCPVEHWVGSGCLGTYSVFQL